MSKREGEKFGDKMRGVTERERERERERVTYQVFRAHLVSYKINTRTAHSYFSKHTKAVGSTILTGFLSQITIQFNSQHAKLGTEWGEIAI